MNLEEFFDYKNQFMKDLCCNADIVTLVTDKADSKVPNHTIAYSQIFPFEFIMDRLLSVLMLTLQKLLIRHFMSLFYMFGYLPIKVK